MTIEELTKLLAQYPKEAIVFIRADYAQLRELASEVNISFDKVPPKTCYGDEMQWADFPDMPSTNATCVRAVCINY